MITDIHYKIFGYVFPPQIKNYFCDNWMLMLYKDNTFYFPNISALNAGGEPRYQPVDAQKICSKLADRDRRKLHLYQALNYNK